MKNKFKLLIILTVMVFLLSSCDFQQYGKNNNEAAKPTAVELTSNKLKKISTNELKEYLKYKKSKIINVFGNEYETGTISSIESHMVFPFIFVKKLGVTFIFSNDIDDFNPLYVFVSKETNINNINIKGAKPGMLFNEIKNILGNSEIKRTWISNEDNIAFKVDYKIDGLVYSFVSTYEDGSNSELYIYQNTEEDETKLTDEQAKVLNFAENGYKYFKEVDFRDPNYIGYKVPEAFSVKLRNQLFKNADETLKKVKENSIICVVNNVKAKNIEIIDENTSKVILEVDITVTEKNITINRKVDVNMTLIKLGDLWLVNSVGESD